MVDPSAANEREKMPSLNYEGFKITPDMRDLFYIVGLCVFASIASIAIIFN